MNESNMKVGVKYVVTKPSDDGTFKLGDHIHIYDDGDVGCVEASGWVSVEDGAQEALIGCEVELDQEHIKRLEDVLAVAKGGE
jgi:hypothetical protein